MLPNNPQVAAGVTVRVTQVNVRISKFVAWPEKKYYRIYLTAFKACDTQGLPEANPSYLL